MQRSILPSGAHTKSWPGSGARALRGEIIGWDCHQPQNFACKYLGVGEACHFFQSTAFSQKATRFKRFTPPAPKRIRGRTRWASIAFLWQLPERKAIASKARRCPVNCRLFARYACSPRHPAAGREVDHRFMFHKVKGRC
jgi:hypothetical protein